MSTDEDISMKGEEEAEVDHELSALLQNVLTDHCTDLYLNWACPDAHTTISVGMTNCVPPHPHLIPFSFLYGS